MTAIGMLLALAVPGAGDVTPLARAHAHNDYEHKRPLLDALDQGFGSVEADVWLVKDELLVAHTAFGIKPGRTLQALYLEPLRERVRKNGGRVYRDGPPFWLLVDVKTEARATCAHLLRVLEGYGDILTVTRDGKTVPGAVTVVVSGNCDREGIARAAVRYAAVDGRPPDLEGDAPAGLVPWVSAAWKPLFKWDGAGAMPEGERKKLKEFVTRAHGQGRRVRFWGVPDHPRGWQELLQADVDLINTDRLAELREFLLREGGGKR